jgi:hypothetical protein
MLKIGQCQSSSLLADGTEGHLEAHNSVGRTRRPPRPRGRDSGTVIACQRALGRAQQQGIPCARQRPVRASFFRQSEEVGVSTTEDRSSDATGTARGGNLCVPGARAHRPWRHVIPFRQRAGGRDGTGGDRPRRARAAHRSSRRGLAGLVRGIHGGRASRRGIAQVSNYDVRGVSAGS